MIELKKAIFADLPLIHQMQVTSFMPLFEKYQDEAQSPARETVEQIALRFAQLNTTYFLILQNQNIVGAVRVVQEEQARCRIAPIFILPQFQGQGIAQKVFCKLEEIYMDTTAWELDTILQEVGNCHLYEKIGYVKTGVYEKINDRMTIVFYRKSKDKIG